MKRRPRKFGIGLDLRHTTSLRIQKPRSCSTVPTRKMLWYEPITQSVPAGLSTRRQAVEPGAGEFVVGLEARELIPVVVDRIDLGIVGALEIARKLQIVRRIGEDQIDRAGRQLRHFRDAIADENSRARCATRTLRALN